MTWRSCSRGFAVVVMANDIVCAVPGKTKVWRVEKVRVTYNRSGFHGVWPAVPSLCPMTATYGCPSLSRLYATDVELARSSLDRLKLYRRIIEQNVSQLPE